MGPKEHIRWLDQEIDTVSLTHVSKLLFWVYTEFLVKAGYFEIGYACQTGLTSCLYHPSFEKKRKG